MSTSIHPTAVVESSVKLGERVKVGPYAVLTGDVEIGDDTELGAAVQVQGPTRLGARNKVFGPCSLGFPPQDLKYAGEPTRLEVGDDNTIREFCTMSRGTTKDRALTTVGSNNLFMAYAHVAHDCVVGSGTIFANGATLAGHVQVGSFSTVGAFSAIHQFCRVGEHAFIGGYTVATQDVLPFMKTVGTRDPQTYGVNAIGLERKGWSKDRVEALQRAYRLLVRSKLPLADALAKIRAELGEQPDVKYLVDFVEGSGKRGFIR
jgi:UDP-N-acetylglucosamine acyltransferase